MRALIDTNIIVDVLQKREPWFESGSRIFLAVANKQVCGCVTAKQVADIHYFLRKQFKGQENADKRARDVLVRLLELFEPTDTCATDCLNAIGINNNDYEDAIMIASAQRMGLDCIVTRNLEHFTCSDVKVFSPDAFLRNIEPSAEL